jgi:uncharacterized membrane protein
MPMILAAAPGLASIGLVMLALGVVGLMFAPAARGEVGRVLATGLVVTLIGASPMLLGGTPGAAFAGAEHGAASPVQQVMLSGMGSQIVYE